MMVCETWVMTLILSLTGADGDGGMGDASILKLIRLLRMSRMARMAKLLRAMPELMILIKGMAVATRSVFFTLCLLALIIYVFAVCLTQITDGSDVHEVYFGTIMQSMSTLLLRGVLADLADIVMNLGEANYGFAVVMLFFILMSTLTVMNMLVGVLVEVVSVVSAVEKEEMTMQYVKSMLMNMIQEGDYDEDHNLCISKEEFSKLLMTPRAAKILQNVGVDVVGLVDFLDFIFKDGEELSFPEFMDVILQLRGSNTATVRDIVDLRKFVLNQVNDAVHTLTNAVNHEPVMSGTIGRHAISDTHAKTNTLKDKQDGHGEYRAVFASVYSNASVGAFDGESNEVDDDDDNEVVQITSSKPTFVQPAPVSSDEVVDSSGQYWDTPSMRGTPNNSQQNWISGMNHGTSQASGSPGLDPGEPVAIAQGRIVQRSSPAGSAFKSSNSPDNRGRPRPSQPPDPDALAFAQYPDMWLQEMQASSNQFDIDEQEV